jgi:zinc resistance-associated protein
MWKPIAVVAAALTVAGLSVVYAQQGYDRDDGNVGRQYQHHRMSAEDIAAFTDARIAALKAGLELTPDQAKNWPIFEQALRDMAQLRAQLRAAREQTPTPTTPFERMTRRADNMAKASAALKHVADAGAPLYQSLSDAQKNRFGMLARFLRPRHHMHARNGGNWREGYDQSRGHGRQFVRDGISGGKNTN